MTSKNAFLVLELALLHGALMHAQSFVDVGGKCGPSVGVCIQRQCCSAEGVCGGGANVTVTDESAWCGTGCQLGFGRCFSTDMIVPAAFAAEVRNRTPMWVSPQVSKPPATSPELAEPPDVLTEPAVTSPEPASSPALPSQQLLSNSSETNNNTTTNNTASSNTINGTNGTQPSTSSQTLSTGALIGIILGAVVILAVAIAVLWVYVRKQKRKPKTSDDEPNVQPSEKDVKDVEQAIVEEGSANDGTSSMTAAASSQTVPHRSNSGAVVSNDAVFATYTHTMWLKMLLEAMGHGANKPTGDGTIQSVHAPPATPTAGIRSQPVVSKTAAIPSQISTKGSLVEPKRSPLRSMPVLAAKKSSSLPKYSSAERPQSFISCSSMPLESSHDSRGNEPPEK